MSSTQITRRDFAKTLITGAAGLAFSPVLAQDTRADAFSFVVLGDLHFDKLEHHDLAWLERDKPDDLRQVRDYSRITAELLPGLLATVREQVAQLSRSPRARTAFVLQLGDLVEGLSGSESLAVRQNTDAVSFINAAGLRVPFLFTRGNHDTTGSGAAEAFKQVFHPFIAWQAGLCGGMATAARSIVEHRDALFCLFDAYDPESLPWLEAALARRTARHCFVALHPPVVPYGARATWHVFSGQKQQKQRDRLLELLGRHRAFVLSGHIHKYSLLVRTTPGNGRFLQLALSSVVPAPVIEPRNILSGKKKYTADQVKVEPDFSPQTEPERRAVIETEAPWVRQFQYADLPGYAIVTIKGPTVEAKVYSGASHHPWRSLHLSRLLET